MNYRQLWHRIMAIVFLSLAIGRADAQDVKRDRPDTIRKSGEVLEASATRRV